MTWKRPQPSDRMSHESGAPADVVEYKEQRIYLGLGVLVSKVECPDTGTGSDVKNPANLGAFLAGRRDSKPVVKAQKPNMMLQVCDAVRRARSWAYLGLRIESPSRSFSLSSLGRLYSGGNVKSWHCKVRR